jgi:hypothetical protein
MHTAEPGEQRAPAAEPVPWFHPRPVAAHVAEPPPSRRDVARAAILTLILFTVLGCLAAWLWSMWADPAHYQVTRDNAVMGELEAGRQFGTDVVYSAIAVVAGLVAGSVLGWRYGRVGWVLPVVTALAAVGAAVIAWRLGIALGPPEPLTAVGAAETGELVPERLDVHARGLLLLWPTAALVGLIASVAATDATARRGR